MSLLAYTFVVPLYYAKFPLIVAGKAQCLSPNQKPNPVYNRILQRPVECYDVSTRALSSLRLAAGLQPRHGNQALASQMSACVTRLPARCLDNV